MSHPNPAIEAFDQTYLASILTTVPIPPGMTQAQVRASVQVILAALHPANPAETLFAGLYIATLFGGIESLRQAEAPELTPTLAGRLRSIGFSAFRLVLTLGRKLEQSRGNQPGANPPGIEAMSVMLAAQAARPFNPMPQHAPGPRPGGEKPATRQPAPPHPAALPPAPRPPAPAEAAKSATPIAPAAPPAQPQSQPTGALPAAAPLPLPQAIPPGLSRKDRKAAKYAFRRAIRAAQADAPSHP